VDIGREAGRQIGITFTHTQLLTHSLTHLFLPSIHAKEEETDGASGFY
jgi:hypothetical protein